MGTLYTHKPVPIDVIVKLHCYTSKTLEDHIFVEVRDDEGGFSKFIRKLHGSVPGSGEIEKTLYDRIGNHFEPRYHSKHKLDPCAHIGEACPFNGVTFCGYKMEKFSLIVNEMYLLKKCPLQFAKGEGAKLGQHTFFKQVLNHSRVLEVTGKRWDDFLTERRTAR